MISSLADFNRFCTFFNNGALLPDSLASIKCLLTVTVLAGNFRYSFDLSGGGDWLFYNV